MSDDCRIENSLHGVSSPFHGELRYALAGIRTSISESGRLVNKKCPHCHVDDFSLIDLFGLDYFHASECRNCGGLVRNSGWSQFLGPLATILLIGGLVLLSPFIPLALVFSLLILLGPLPILLLAKPVKAEPPNNDSSPFNPNPSNDKAILIQGWNENELRKILEDFLEEDLSTFAPFRIHIQRRFENSFALTFPEDILPAEFLSLINYLVYPINLDPAGRSIVVAGRTTLNSDFDGLPKSLEGKRALLYIPENDEDSDVVYLQTESGASLAKSFNEEVWRKVKDARLSSAVKLLTR